MRPILRREPLPDAGITHSESRPVPVSDGENEMRSGFAHGSFVRADTRGR
jgi:hypothetical protein